MKRMTKLIFVLLICSIFVFTGCSNKSIEKHNTMILGSMEKVVSVEKNIKFYDSEVLVHDETEKYVIEGTKADVEKTTLTLGNNFELVSTTTTSSINDFNKNSLFNMNLKEELLSNIVYGENVLTFEVASDKFSVVFKNTELNIQGNAQVKFTYNDKLISSIDISFTTITNKNVVVKMSYSY